MSKGARILFIRKGVEVLFGLIVFVVLARTLSKEQFAIYTLIFAIVAIMNLTALPGLGAAVAQAFARKLPGSFRDSVKLSIFSSLIGSVLFLLIAGWYFHQGDNAMAQVLAVAAVGFPFANGLLLWRNATLGLERYVQLLWFDISTSVLKCGGIVLCVYFFPQQLLPVVIAAFFGTALVNLVATSVRLAGVRRDAGSEPNSIRYGVQTTFYQFPTVLARHLDKLVLFYFISPEAMAIYMVAQRIPDLVWTVVMETNATLAPVFAREPNYSMSLHHFTYKLWLIYLAVSAVIALFIVPYLLPMLAGSSYLEAVPVAQILVIGAALGYLGEIQLRYITSHLHSRSFLVISIGTAVSDCILIVSLAYYFGLMGVVAAFALKNLIYSLITDTVIRLKYLNVKQVPQQAG